MLSLNRLVRVTGAALALAATAISTSANAGMFLPGWGVGPNNDGWGMNPQQNVGHRSRDRVLGHELTQQNIGLGATARSGA